MDFLPENINQYSEKYTQKESSLLKQINRETNLHQMIPRMLSGHLQGRFLAMISRMIQPERILEIGTFTGYSALCLAEGLTPKGKLTTIDCNDELVPVVEKYIAQSGIAEKINFVVGNAVNIIPQLNDIFDLVFIDADKTNYSKYYHLVFDKIKAGGYLIADNILWSGKVCQDLTNADKDTLALVAFTKLVHEDKCVENVLLPIRDGLMICRKL